MINILRHCLAFRMGSNMLRLRFLPIMKKSITNPTNKASKSAKSKASAVLILLISPSKSAIALAFCASCA